MLCAVAVTLCALSGAPPASGAAARVAAAAERFPGAVTLNWVGDIALDAQRGLPPGGAAGALASVARWLRGGDVAVGNLEGTLSAGGASKCGGIGGGTCFAFQAPTWIAGQLRRAGFGVLNLANNHSLDYGPSGRAQTIGALDAAGITHAGLPGSITVRRIHGVRVAFLGFAPYPYDGDLLDIPAAARLVTRARRVAPIVVVIIHAGAEGADQLHTPLGDETYLGEDRGNPRAFAHAAIRAGAALVLGSGPHVVRGIERYRGRLIAYSLGNFVGYHTLGGGGVLSESGILRVTVGAGGRLFGARWISVRLDDGLPHPDGSQASAHLVAALSRQDFAGDHFDIGPDGTFEHLGPPLAARLPKAGGV